MWKEEEEWDENWVHLIQVMGSWVRMGKEWIRLLGGFVVDFI